MTYSPPDVFPDGDGIETAYAPDWTWVRRGLFLKLVAVCLFAILLVGVAAIGVFGSPASLQAHVPNALAAFVAICAVLDLSGRALCLFSPDIGTARRAVAVSVVAQVAAAFVFIVPIFAIPELPLAVRCALGFPFSLIAQAIAAKLFMVFTRDVALAVDRPDLAERSNNVLWLFGMAGGTFTTSYLPLAIVIVAMIACPCLWWPLYVVLSVLGRMWSEAGGSAESFWLGLRVAFIAPALLLAAPPLIRYSRLIWQLAAAVGRR